MMLMWMVPGVPSGSRGRSAEPPMGREVQLSDLTISALERHVETEMRKGVSVTGIRQRLLAQGWPDATVTDAFHFAILRM